MFNSFRLLCLLLNNDYCLKNLKFKIKVLSGRNNEGKIVTYNRGGGKKRRIYNVDFNRNFSSFGVVLKIIYDKKRTGLLALVYFFIGKVSYILISKNMKVGDFFFFGSNIFIFWYILKKSNILRNIIKKFNLIIILLLKKMLLLEGNCIKLKYIPKKSFVYNLELFFDSKAKLVRAGGTSSLVLKNFKKSKVVIKLRSNFYIFLNENCLVNIGIVAKDLRNLLNKKKAGYRRLLGFRSKVRGVAMNPVDHPHGGGEGRTSGGKPSVSPWGKITKGVVTVNKRKRLLKKNIYRYEIKV